MEKYEINKLEADIKALQASHTALASSSTLGELLNVIHRPGWTTPAELAFVEAGLESIQAQTRQLAAFTQGLLNAALQVGATRAAGA